MDAGTLCSPQGDKVQFDGEVIKHQCDAKDAPSWVCHPPPAGKCLEKRKHERSDSFLLIAHNPQTVTEDGPPDCLTAHLSNLLE